MSGLLTNKNVNKKHGLNYLITQVLRYCTLFLTFSKTFIIEIL